MKMNQMKTLLTAVAVFDMAYVGFVSAEDMIYRIRKWRKKKKKSNASVLDEDEDFDLDWDEDEDFDLEWLDDEDFDLDGLDDDEEDEPEGEPDTLTMDIITKNTMPVRRIVEIMFDQPEVKPLLRCLKYEEKEAARSLLSAYIGYLAENALDEKRSFLELRELLNMTDTDPGTNRPEPVERVLEGRAVIGEKMPQYLMDYWDYRNTLRRFNFVDKCRVVETCQLIVGIVMVRLGIAYDPYEKSGVI